MEHLGRLLAISTMLLTAGCAQAQPGPTADTAPPPSARLASPPDAALGNVGFPRYPSLSPDGGTLVFSWAGDLWSVPSTGGQATRLTVHPGEELRSAFSPDGAMLAFESRRAGYQNLYVADVAGRNIRRVTFNDRYAYLRGWTPDSSKLIFDSHLAHTIDKQRQMYTVPAEGGPIHRLMECLGRRASVSQDGNRIAFVRGHSRWMRRNYRGAAARNIWVCDVPSDTFTQLTTRDGNDGQPAILPNGSILFASDRDGAVNVYRLPAGATDDSAARRMTFFDDDDVRDLTVSADGRIAAFVVWDRLYTLDLVRAGATPKQVIAWAGGDETGFDERLTDLSSTITEVSLSPDGKTYALVARGEIYIQAVEGDRPARRVTDSPWRERHIAWSPDGAELYFVSDESGTNAIYAATVTLDEIDVRGEEEEEEETEEEPVEEEPAEPAEETEDAEPEEGVEDTPASEEEAPDAIADEDEADEEEADEADEPVEEEKDKPRRKQWDRSLRFEIEPVVVTASDDAAPTPSPDGKFLAFQRGRGNLIILDLATDEERVLLDYWNLDSFEWSGDSSMMLFVREDNDNNADVWIIPADGSKPAVNISQHPDNDYFAVFSADSKIVAFTSDRDEDNNFDVYAVYLDKSLEGLPAYELEEYYDEAIAVAKKRKPLEPADDDEDDADDDEQEPGESEEGEEQEPDDEDEATDDDEEESESLFDTLDLDDAYLRLRRITSIPGEEFNIAVTPGGDRIIFTASVDGSDGLYSIKWDGSERKKLDGGGASNVSVSLTGSNVTYVRSGRAKTVSPGGGSTDGPSFRARILVNIADQQRQKFLEAARLLGEFFYDPTMKGHNWHEITDKYADLAAKTRTNEEFNLVANMLFGELNASHMGMYGAGAGGTQRMPVGYLGALYDVTDAGYRVTQVLSGGPVDQSEAGLHVGDTIIAVDGIAVPSEMVLDEAMAGKVGRQVLLTVRRADAADDNANDDNDDTAEDDEPQYILADPIGYWDENALAYDDQVRHRAAWVAEQSDGRIGYVHIETMNIPSVKKFERDLYAVAHGKDGLIIDVRSNGGGWTTDILLSSIMVQPHAYTIPRGSDRYGPPGYPQDRRLIYAYSKPITVLCNQESFSNAEIFAHAIKTLGRGTLVGTPTYGGVISTGGTALIDGTTVRLPLRGWYLPHGANMELNGAVPDIIVEQTPEDEITGEDRQLKAAVEELLSRLP
ncbi:MAG: PD40 domain-containing protein [Phycisphaerales bacterium]|nr:PD40 domain-containing protein [Phycisphaerales bacterium]